MASSLTQVRLGYHCTRSRAVGRSPAASPSPLSGSLTGSFQLPSGVLGMEPQSHASGQRQMLHEPPGRESRSSRPSSQSHRSRVAVALSRSPGPSSVFAPSLSYRPCRSQWFPNHGSIPGARPCCRLDFHSPQLEWGRTQARCEGRTRLCPGEVPAPVDNFLGIGDGCPQRLLLPPRKQGGPQAAPKHAWLSATTSCLTQPAVQVKLETIFNRCINRCPHRGPKDRDSWAGSCNACWSLLPRIIISCTSRNLRS